MIGTIRVVGLLALGGVGWGVPAAAQHDTPVEIPLRIVGGRMVVPVVAGETRLEFALTTGSAATVLSARSARLAEGMPLTLGGVTVPIGDAVTVPDKDLRAGGTVLDGMISSNMLNQFDVLLDVPAGRLVLKPIGPVVDWGGMTMSDPVRLRVYHGVVLGLDVQLAGRTYPAMLDLSAPFVVANERVKTDLELRDDDTTSLKIGHTTLPAVPVRVRDLELFRRWAPDGGPFVLLGAPVAYDCALAISWVHREMRTCVR